jgi:L-rhamnose mutarotase
MIRKAFRMSVNADRHDEYTRRHNPIWRELEETFREHGVISYSIFLDSQTSELFGYAEIEDEERWDAIAATDVCQRWWHHMRDVMPCGPDNRPLTRTLHEVFHIDGDRPLPRR